MDNFSYLENANAFYLDELHRQYLENPSAVDPGWQRFFEGFEFARKQYPLKKSSAGSAFDDEVKVINLVNAYRERGHYFTLTNPVRTRRQYSPTLDIENFGLVEKDLDRTFAAGSELGLGAATLRHIVEELKITYCSHLGVEYMYIRRPEIVSWLKQNMESRRNKSAFSAEQKKMILHKVSEAVLFERYLHTRYPGQKSFSLEGAEALIPALDAVIRKGAAHGCLEFVIGMPHRGRLNVLANILHKSYEAIFTEFAGAPFEDHYLQGDVKYHLGYSSDYETGEGRPVHLTLTPNPSHLEAVGPVVEGIVRAKTDKYNDCTGSKVVPILIHGDASVSGQGVIYELLQMSELQGYRTGGTIHIVVNNQIGFTTNYQDGRSSIYCTDVAKTIQSPIFHVNGDDVEAVVYTVLLAMDYRKKFHKDVFIDLLCYRRYGHNESDEPRYTQPLLYKIIEKHPNLLDIYIEKLRNEGVIGISETALIKEQFDRMLEDGYLASKQKTHATIRAFLENLWTGIVRADTTIIHKEFETGIAPLLLNEIGTKITQLPAEKTFFKKIVKLQSDRRAMLSENGNVDWAMAELLAMGSLLQEGFPVRLSGQDVKRGTFSQRHSVLTVEDSEEEFIPLNTISDSQAKFDVYNSLLSEYGVLGFEYGYALATPNGLTIWEAQFGDFGNGGQIIIDQFLTCAEEKWNVMNGLVLLLPHGYEGQGPEHSSGRLERFMVLCAGNNITVANCSTPANYFHLLRRQLHRPFRKPLVVFTPKSLLRNPACVSSPEAFTAGSFSEIMDDATTAAEKITRIILCTGKIYYELADERNKNGIDTVAIIRIEQLFPLDTEKLQKIMSRYRGAIEFLWVQEEPANMGAGPFMMRSLTFSPFILVARPESGSPATGSAQVHKIEQRQIIERAFQ
ncbi:MAG: 2-oxoglutarate dehydrogenase E1 component [Bacteroidota bacterium]